MTADVITTCSRGHERLRGARCAQCLSIHRMHRASRRTGADDLTRQLCAKGHDLTIHRSRWEGGAYYCAECLRLYSRPGRPAGGGGMTASQTDAFLRLQEAYERCATHWERQQVRDAMDRILAQSDAVPPASSHRP